MGVRLEAFRFAKHAWHQPRDGFRHYRCGQLAPCQHVVSDAEPIGGVFFGEPLVKTLIPAANDYYVHGSRKGRCTNLVKALACRVGEYDTRRRRQSTRFDCAAEDVGSKDHAGPTSEWIVVHRLALVGGKVSRIDGCKAQDSGALGTRNDSVPQRPKDQVWEQRDEVNPEHAS